MKIPERHQLTWLCGGFLSAVDSKKSKNHFFFYIKHLYSNIKPTVPRHI